MLRALSRHWRALGELFVIMSLAAIIWLVIQRTGTCDRFIAWLAVNPDYEIDSLILGGQLAAIGAAIFTWRRYRELRIANSARDTAEQRFHKLAYHDPLTGLFNRRALNERLSGISSAKGGEPLALVLLDLDRFKAVNDLHGHLAGDRLLRLVGDRLQFLLGSREIAYRLGGDELAVVIKLTSLNDRTPRRLARRIVNSLAEPFNDQGLVHHIGASAGIAVYPLDAADGDALIRSADVALYRAKKGGGNQCRSYEQAMDDRSRQRFELEQELRQSIRDDEFQPFYQPLVCLESGAVTGFEMLARWIRTDGVQIGPDLFIPIAEECGLINELFLVLLEKACGDARDWDPKLTIAMNLSSVQLKDPFLSEKILKTLVRHGFPPQRLSIEITENAIIADEVNARRTMESLKNLGMQIALDDFGTGYSSLHHLRILPFDKIKIDKSFIRNLGEDTEGVKIVKAIVSLAASLELPILAEGIESAEVAALLQTMGCNHGQGYHFGRAVPAAMIDRNLAELALQGEWAVTPPETTAWPRPTPQAPRRAVPG